MPATTQNTEPKSCSPRSLNPASPNLVHVADNSTTTGRHSIITDIVLNSNDENNSNQQNRPVLMSTDSNEISDSNQCASPSSSLSPVSPTSPLNAKPLIEQSTNQCKSPRNSIININTTTPNERQNNNTPLVNSMAAITDRLNNSNNSYTPERTTIENSVRPDHEEIIQENQSRSQQNTPRQSDSSRGRR